MPRFKLIYRGLRPLRYMKDDVECVEWRSMWEAMDEDDNSAGELFAVAGDTYEYWSDGEMTEFPTFVDALVQIENGMVMRGEQS